MRRDQTLEARCRRVMLAIGWDLPFFLMPAAAVHYVEAPGLGTLSVNLDGEVKIDPVFASTLSDRRLAWCLCHELMHLLMTHHSRTAGFVDKERINRAQDMAINQVLREMAHTILDAPPWAYYPPKGAEAKTSEEIYSIISPAPAQPDAPPPKPGAGCGVQGSNAGQEGRNEANGLERKWQEVAAKARAMAGVGSAAGQALARLTAIPPARVKWEQVLRGAASHALSRHGRDEQTWTRRARRAPVGVILPGWQATQAKVAVVIDASGSVSDEQLARCVAETAKIGRTLAGVQIFLVVHDARVQWSGWLHVSQPEQVKRTLKGRGGTVFEVAYQAVAGVSRGNFDVLVHLTDGECAGTWPAPPRNTRRFIAALVGSNASPRPPGAITLRVE